MVCPILLRFGVTGSYSVEAIEKNITIKYKKPSNAIKRDVSCLACVEKQFYFGLESLGHVA